MPGTVGDGVELGKEEVVFGQGEFAFVFIVDFAMIEFLEFEGFGKEEI